MSLRVLVACEFSGTVRRAFREMGHDAYSSDLLPAEDGSEHHFQGDVREVLRSGWDLVIAHPPCTFLTNAGVRWMHEKPGRWAQMRDGVDFFSSFFGCAPYVAIENPVMHGYAAARVGRDFTQSFQPHQFGDPAFKRICLWLENLPPLVPTDALSVPKAGTDEHKAWSRVHRAPPGPERAKERSRFFPGVARAMAEQWTAYIQQRAAA